MLDCFEVALGRSRESGKATAEVYAPFVEFFRGFADQCHHCKEEDRLFPELEKQGIPRAGGPIECMLEEHRIGRAHVKAISEAIEAADGGDEAAINRILDKGDSFLDLLRLHINKEDKVLFEMADQLVQGSSLAQLTRGYAEAESTPEYSETAKRCMAIADRLIEMYTPAKA